jgi:hypothetical protein
LGHNRSGSEQLPSNTPGSGSSDTQDPPESPDIVNMQNMDVFNIFWAAKAIMMNAVIHQNQNQSMWLKDCDWKRQRNSE